MSLHHIIQMIKLILVLVSQEIYCRHVSIVSKKLQRVLQYTSFWHTQSVELTHQQSKLFIFFYSKFIRILFYTTCVYLYYSSLPTVMFYLRYVSLYFLGCESMSCLFWGEIKSLRKYIFDRFLQVSKTLNYTILFLSFFFLACYEVDNCLNDGQSVLNKYGFKSDDLNFDIKILLAFCVIAHIISYFGLLNRIKKQSVY